MGKTLSIEQVYHASEEVWDSSLRGRQIFWGNIDNLYWPCKGDIYRLFGTINQCPPVNGNMSREGQKMIFNYFGWVIFQIVLVVIMSNWTTDAQAKRNDFAETHQPRLSFGNLQPKKVIWPAWLCLVRDDAEILWELRREDGDLVAKAVFLKFQARGRCENGNVTPNGPSNKVWERLQKWQDEGILILPKEKVNIPSEFDPKRVQDEVFFIYRGPFYRWSKNELVARGDLMSKRARHLFLY